MPSRAEVIVFSPILGLLPDSGKRARGAHLSAACRDRLAWPWQRSFPGVNTAICSQIGAFLFAQRAFLHSRQGLIYFGAVSYACQYDIHIGVGEREAVAVRDGRHVVICRITPRWNMKEVVRLVRNIEGDNARVARFISREMREDVLFHTGMGEVIAAHQHIEFSQRPVGRLARVERATDKSYQAATQ